MTSQHRALVLTNRLPFPLDDGWKMRTFHILRGVANIAPATLATFHPEDGGEVLEAARAALGPSVEIVTVPPPRRPYAASLLLGTVTPQPFAVWRTESPRMREVVRDVCARGVDVVVNVMTLWERYQDLLPPSALRVVDTHNIDSLVMQRYTDHDPSRLRRAYASMTVRKLEALERRMFSAADLVWVCSDVEAELLAERVPAANVRVAPNGVDTSHFRPASGRRPVPKRLLFFGRLDYYPNTDAVGHFVDDILPLVQREEPDVEVVVVGSGDRAAVAAAAARNPAVRVVGRVDDVRAALGEAAVVVVPLRSGGGTRLKIVEALSSACPVVSTSLGAEGLDVQSGRELQLADTPAAFAADVVRLLRDPAYAEALGRRGRDAMIARYDWDSIGQLVARDLEQAWSRRAPDGCGTVARVAGADVGVGG